MELSCSIKHEEGKEQRNEPLIGHEVDFRLPRTSIDNAAQLESLIRAEPNRAELQCKAWLDSL